MSTTPPRQRLTLAQLAAHKKLPPGWLADLGLRDAGGAVLIDYHDRAGRVTHGKRRTALVAKLGSYWPKDTPAEPYGRERLVYVGPADTLHLVEGESDCWTLWHHGLPALGIPGANNTKCLQEEDLAGVGAVLIVQEKGKGGQDFVAGLRVRLAQLGYAGKASVLEMPAVPKDPSELHCQAPEKFTRLWAELCLDALPLDVRAPAPSVPAGPAPPQQPEWEPPLPLAEMPAPQPFPLHVLPGPVARFVEELAASTNTPPDYGACFCLALAGGAIGSSMVLYIKEGHCEGANLYLAVVGKAGKGKSPVLGQCAAPFYAEQARRRVEHRAARKAWDKEPEYDRGDEPHLQSAFIGNCTVEALAIELSTNPRGFPRIEDEITAWATGLDQYRSGGKGCDRQAYLSLWSRSPFSVHRAKDRGESILVSHPFLALCGGLPPGCLEKLRGDTSLIDGWLDRVLFSYPEPLPAVGETWCVVRPEVRQAWHQVVQELWEIPLPHDEHGQPRPYYARLTREGRGAWEDFTAMLAAQQNAEDFPDYLDGTWSKLRSYGGRLALIVHALRTACRETREGDVDGRSMEAGAELVGYFGRHMQRVYCALDADPAVAAAKRVLACLAGWEGDVVTRRDLYLALKNRTSVKSPEDLDQHVALLQRYGYIRPCPCERQGEVGRKPGPAYLINPLWGRPRNLQNLQNSAP